MVRWHEELNNLLDAVYKAIDDPDDGNLARLNYCAYNLELHSVPPDPNLPSCECGWVGYPRRPFPGAYGLCDACDKPVFPTPTVCVDFDGPLHTLDRGWRDGELYGSPPPGAVEAIRALRRQGFRIVVQTARDWRCVHGYLIKHGIEVDLITMIKPIASFYIDDRGVVFEDWYSVMAEIKRRQGVVRES